MSYARFLLKASRPGLWFQTVWLYVLPAAGTATLELPLWWVGLFYVTFPLNLLVYGWNDAVDIETDARNPRKDSWFFGARGTESQLARLPKWIVFCQLPFVALFSYVSGLTAALFFGGMVLINGLYNWPGQGLRGKPPFDLIAPMGYLLVVVLGSALSQVSLPSLWAFAYLALFCGHAQLMGQVMDIEPDKAAGRCTTATRLGAITSKLVIIGMVATEGLVVGLVFDDWVLGGFLLATVPALGVDLYFQGARRYSNAQFTLFGLGMNAAGFLSMVWVWFNRSFSG